jgi:GNAT superfamily N-acetyltransferase
VHTLLQAFLDAADGRFPPVDGGVTRIDPDGDVRAVVAFTGHSFVMAPEPILPPPGVPAPDGFGGAHDPHYLAWLVGPDRPIGVLDATLVRRGTGAGARRLEHSDRWDGHPRVVHARSLRTDVEVFGDERGFVTLASGLAGRRELSVEADPAGHGRGWGRSLVSDALGLVPDGAPIFAAVSPGNARSLRAFLALGFAPIGSEQQWIALS